MQEPKRCFMTLSERTRNIWSISLAVQAVDPTWNGSPLGYCRVHLM